MNHIVSDSCKLSAGILILFITSCTTLYAQGILLRDVKAGGQKPEKIRRLLEKVSDRQNFSFAYNNKLVPADSIVSLPRYSGRLLGLLEQIFGQNYEFKEVSRYIVIRYAPRKLSIMAEVFRDQHGQTLLRGYVRDLSDQKPVAQASVYEKNLLLSALTDVSGYFELNLKSYRGSLILIASKEIYRDTCLNLLPDVIVTFKNRPKNFNFYPDNATGSSVENSRFARFFISSKQLLQGINIGDLFISSPYQLSLLPGISTQGLFNSQVIAHLSINLIGGYTAGTDGAELAGLFNLNRKDMMGLQIAPIFNFVGGNAKGVQIAGLYNRVLNNGSGLQLAGLTNINRDSSSVQVAGLLNKSKHATVLQAGVLNIAKRATGLQFGVVNIADSSDYPIGLINFVKNGQQSISLSTDESLFSHVDFRSGGKVLYGLIGFGYNQGTEKRKYTLNAGIGAHLLNHKNFFINTELVLSFLPGTSDNQNKTLSIRLLPGYNLTHHWGFLAGPAIRFFSFDKNHAGLTAGIFYRF